MGLSFSFLRGVVAPIAAINRYSCACARVHAWLCGCVGNVFGFQRARLGRRHAAALFPHEEDGAFPLAAFVLLPSVDGPILGMKFARLSPFPSRRGIRGILHPEFRLPRSTFKTTNAFLRQLFANSCFEIHFDIRFVFAEQPRINEIERMGKSRRIVTVDCYRWEVGLVSFQRLFNFFPYRFVFEKCFFHIE